MLKTLDRYILREILPPLFLSLLIFTFILTLPPVMEQLESLVAKGVTFGIAARMLATLIPQALGLTIPMSLLVGVLIGLGRMSGDREAVALLACGVSPYRLLRPILALALAAAGLHLWVMISAIPDANQTFRELSYEVVSKRVENDVHPQVFFEDFPGWVLYAQDIPQNRAGWRNVLVADTSKPEAVVLYMARQGRLVLDRAKQTVDLVLEDGNRYSSSGPNGRQVETFRFPGELIVKLDPQSVFPRMELQRGLAELTIPELRAQAAAKLAAGLPPHQEIIYLEQKFSFPVACLVFAVIGLALGMTVAREGKVAAFVVGIAVIFSYYILLYLAEALAKGYYGRVGAQGTLLAAHLTRWAPNLVLLPFGILALIWRARWAEGRIPFRSVVSLTNNVAAWVNRHREPGTLDPALRTPHSALRTPHSAFRTPHSAFRTPHSALRTPHSALRTPRVVLVIRVPRMWWSIPNILDRYVARIYLRATGISFLALLGIFYISTFIDRSDKLFKGQASGAMLLRLLAFLTPQYIYYVIPLAALVSVLVTFGVLSRTSELAVMKACGISLYRIALPLLLLSVVWSGVLYGLEQQIMARANQRADALDAQIRGRPPRTSNPLNRRWLVARDGSIYHYTYFDPLRKALDNLVIYRPSADRWQLASELFTPQAAYAGGEWVAGTGWQQDFTGARGRWRVFPRRTLRLETPDYFETEQPIAEMMTVPQLKHHIDELAASGFNVVTLTVELQKKLAFPCVTIVMTLLAIPFGLTTGKRGTLYGIGIAIVLALAYWIVGNAFAAIGKSGLLGPVLAGWAPNVLAAGSAAYLLLTART